MHGEQLHQRIRADVAARRPVDEREAISIERFLTFFDALAAPLDQESDPVHVTGSGVVIGPRVCCCSNTGGSGSGSSPGAHRSR
jgi:hypothetical protein